MTGRRAMRGPDERLSRALQFIPGHVGGRVASAQPIRRRGGTLRRVSVGAGGAVPLLGYSGARASGTSINVNDFYDMPDFTNSVVPAAGDMAVALAFGYSCSGITAPAGWTTLASGSAGSLDYRIAWLEVTGSDSWTFTAGASSPVYDSATAAGKSRATAWLFKGGTPTVDVAERAATSSVAMPGGGFWNAFACVYDTGESRSVTAGNISGFPQWPTLHLDERFGLRSDEIQVGNLFGAATNVDGGASPTATDWITCAFGWA